MIQKNTICLFSRLTALVLALFLTAVANAATGDIYVSGGGQQFQVSLNGTKISLPLSFANTSGIATDAAGNLYLADATANTVTKIDPSGVQTTVATGLNNPQGLLVDPSGNLYIANAGTNSILKVATDGTKTPVAVGLNDPTDIARDILGNLFVSNTGANAILKIGTDGTQSTVATNLSAPKGLAFDATGNLLVANSGANSIVKIAPDGTQTTVNATGLDSPQDVVPDNLGNLYVPNAGNGVLSQIAPNGVTTPIASGLGSPQSAAAATDVHQLLNISTRGLVGTGDGVLIGGFIVQGAVNGDLGQTQVLLRAIGPSLASSGVSGTLADPVLELHDSSGRLIASNDNWKDSQQSDIEATGLQPSNDKESAILATLPDSSYTAIVRGAGDTTGVALVEAYKVSQ